MSLSFILWLLLAIFFSVNLFLIYKDWRYKVIPNSLLVILIILCPIFFFYWKYIGYLSSFDIRNYSISIIFVFVVSFFLYVYHWWAAWDAKYSIVLSLFLFHGNYLSFAGNMAVFTIAILLIFSLVQAIYLKTIDLEKKERVQLIKKDRELTEKFFIGIQYTLLLILTFVLLQMFREDITAYFYTLHDPKNPLYPTVTVCIILAFRSLNRMVSKKSRDTFNFTILTVLILSFFLLVYIRWFERFLYDLLFIGKYSIPTMIVISWFLIGFSRLIRKSDYIPRSVNDIEIGDLLEIEHAIWTFESVIPEKEKPQTISTIQSMFATPINKDSRKFLRDLTIGKEKTI
jgi:Flp pilus assembly protein protease CpaA